MTLECAFCGEEIGIITDEVKGKELKNILFCSQECQEAFSSDEEEVEEDEDEEEVISEKEGEENESN